MNTISKWLTALALLVGPVAANAGHRRAAVSAHGQTDEIQVSDVGGLGALVTAIVVLCTCVLSAVLSAALMLFQG
jgi:hypothetical protein